MMENKISIITVCFNCEELIERTIESVISQTYANVQYVVIDGASTDNTLNAIERYKNQIDIIISEKDDGIYDAMNKGLEYATGDILYFLNAGDYLYNKDVLRNVVEKFKANPNSDIIYGDYIHYDDQSEEQCSGYRADIPDLLRRGYCHQTVFTKRSTFTKCGKFNTNYKIYADLDWLLRGLTRFSQKMSYIGIPIAYYSKGGESENHGDKYDYEIVTIFWKSVGYHDLLFFAISYPIDLLLWIPKLIRYKNSMNHLRPEV